MMQSETKNELRKKTLEKRNRLAKNGSSAICSNLIVSKILNSKDFQNAKHVALYYPIKNEIDLRNLLKVENKSFYLPKCDENNNLSFAKYEGEDNLISAKFSIMEPKGSEINPEILDIIYIPALCANKENYRLGYGKGCYDRFFHNHNTLKAKKVITVAKEFTNQNFKEDSFDVKCDYIICE